MEVTVVKKILILIVVMTLFITGFAFAEVSQTPALSQDLVVLFTSDVHCAVDSGFGYVGLAAIRDQMAAQGKHVLLVDNGDSIQGEPIGTMTSGEANIRLMNAVGYDIATMGNHEFDYGMERFFELAAMAEFPYISANFNRNGELLFDSYIIKEFDGVKVAFVGVSTPKSLTSSAPRHFQNEQGEFIYGFCQDETGEAFYAAVQRAIDAARSEGADYVVGMGHLGNSAACSPWTYAELIANTTGMDALLDGHSHDADQVEMLNKEGKTVLRSACGTRLEGVGYLVISTDGEISTGLFGWDNELSAPELLGLENGISAAVEEATALLNEQLSAVVAQTSVDLVIADPETGVRIVRSAETNLGNLAADAYRAATGADVAFINGGGVRSSIQSGDITLNDILMVNPYGNALCVVEISGQELLDALEMAVRAVPGEFGGFQQVSGLTFEFRTDLPSPVVLDESKMFERIEGERRVRNVLIGGQPLEPERVYTLAASNYTLKNMGDGFGMFADNRLLQDEVILDNQALIDYITDVLGGVVGEEYANPYGEGRIVAVTGAE